MCIIVIVFLIIGIFFLIIGIAIKVTRENKESIDQRLTEYEDKKLSVKNLNFAIYLSVFSIAIAIFFGVLSYAQNSAADGFDLPMINDDSLSYPTVQDKIITDLETESETYYNYFEETQATEAYDSFMEETDNNDNNSNIITNDCILEDTFSESSIIKKYELKSSYNSEYGFDFSIDNIDLSYTVLIKDEKGGIVKEFGIPGNNNTYAVKLNKNHTYTVMVEAGKGYPKFSIKVLYPENDDF